MNKNIFSYATLSSEDLFKKFNSSVQGLGTFQAKERFLKEGPNELVSQEIFWWQILLRQLRSPFIYLLIGAAILTFLLGEKLDAFLIFLFILINTFLGFYQEFKSEKALKVLKHYLKPFAKIIRKGERLIIPTRELVPGDLVILETGDLVPADIRLIEGNVLVNESILTGESAPINKNCLPLEKIPSEIYQATNLIFSGTEIVKGEAKGIVVATGKNTAFGEIKKLISATKKESAFVKGISRFANFIVKLVLITLIFIILVNVALKGKSANLPELIIFGIALAVSVVPEALPLVATLSFSRAALKLTKKKVIVKRLAAVEELGGIQILCTDKTGTITKNKLEVKNFFPIEKKENLLIFANLLNPFLKESLEPFDIAFKKALKKKEKLSDFEQISFLPFEPERKRNSVLVKDKQGNFLLIVRGAPEEIIKLSGNLNEKEKKDFQKWFLKESRKGFRVLAISTKKIKEEEKYLEINSLEKGLNLEGFISFFDPIKKSAFEAVKKAKTLNVEIKILTGDNKKVALQVAKEINLVRQENEVIEAEKFLSFSEEKQEELLPKIKVFARANPQQKHSLVKLIEKKKEVGFLGEGINDCPALKASGVSIVVQSAADVAREVADIILLKKDLSVIIEAIEEGRRTFSNTIKYIKVTLASNFGNFYAVAAASLFIDFLPMLPVQLLLVNLLSDFPMIAIATDTVSKKEIAKPKQYNVKDIVLICTILGIVSTIFDFIFFRLFYKISPQVLQTNWFIASVLTELVFLFSIRTVLPSYKGSFPSKTILVLSAIAFFATIWLPFTTFGQNVFHFIKPTQNHLILILLLVLAYFICTEIFKNLYYKRNRED